LRNIHTAANSSELPSNVLVTRQTKPTKEATCQSDIKSEVPARFAFKLVYFQAWVAVAIEASVDKAFA
jgi:hypothetical protein